VQKIPFLGRDGIPLMCESYVIFCMS
jgi:hypothetical protein